MKTRILLVDDDADLTEILGEHLTEDGYEIFRVHSAEEFRSQALLLHPHLIILDIRLGSADGPENYKYLLSKGLDKNIPVIFLSGLVPENAGLPAAPGRRYVLHPKPFDYEKLRRDIRILLSQSSQGRMAG